MNEQLLALCTALWPSNPILVLQTIARDWSDVSSRQEYRRLSAVLSALRGRDIACTVEALQAFRLQAELPEELLPREAHSHRRPVVPVFSSRMGQGLIAPLDLSPATDFAVQPHLQIRIDKLWSLASLAQRALRNLTGREYPLSLRLPCTVSTCYPESIAGRSMELPLLLAILRRVAPEGASLKPIFASAGIDEAGRLEEVEHFEEKLNAFLREVGPGATAVVTPRQRALLGDRRSLFEEVLVVSTVDELMAALFRKAWLADALEPINNVEADRLLATVRSLFGQQLHRVALQAAEAMEACGHALTAPQKVELLGLVQYGHSYFGRFQEGIHYLEKARTLLDEQTGLVGHDWRADKLNKMAVQFYDAHRFREGRNLLVQISGEKGDEFPDHMDRVLAAKILGTLGQMETALDRFNEGQHLLEKCVHMLKQVAPSEVSRACNYLVHNRLRAGSPDEAEQLLKESASWVDLMDTYGRQFRSFYRAEIARQRNSPAPEDLQLVENLPLPHPLAFTLQALARNQALALEQRLGFISRAAKILEAHEAGGVCRFLALCYRLYEARLLKNDDEFAARRQELREWMAEVGSEPYQARYQGFLEAENRPLSFAEALLAAVPYH
ncbi:MAG: hypothetical protein ACLFVT_01930 [Syntrophobacteria bacterium]